MKAEIILLTDDPTIDIITSLESKETDFVFKTNSGELRIVVPMYTFYKTLEQLISNEAHRIFENWKEQIK